MLAADRRRALLAGAQLALDSFGLARDEAARALARSELTYRLARLRLELEVQADVLRVELANRRRLEVAS